MIENTHTDATTYGPCCGRRYFEIEGAEREILCGLDAGHSAAHSDGLRTWDPSDAELAATQVPDARATYHRVVEES